MMRTLLFGLRWIAIGMHLASISGLCHAQQEWYIGCGTGPGLNKGWSTVAEAFDSCVRPLEHCVWSHEKAPGAGIEVDRSSSYPVYKMKFISRKDNWCQPLCPGSDYNPNWCIPAQNESTQFVNTTRCAEGTTYVPQKAACWPVKEIYHDRTCQPSVNDPIFPLSGGNSQRVDLSMLRSRDLGNFPVIQYDSEPQSGLPLFRDRVQLVPAMSFGWSNLWRSNAHRRLLGLPRSARIQGCT